MEISTYYTIDFGANFASNKRYPDKLLNNLMEKSWNEGVDKIVSISNNIKEAHYNLILSEKYENLYFTLGVHPHNAKQFEINDLKFIEENLTNKKCFAIGECGLDYNRMFSPKEKQIEVFIHQVELAKKTNSKLYLHCRDAYKDFLTILKKYEYYNGLMHCFTGNIDEAIELTSLGLRLGITGFLLNKKRNEEIIKVIQNKQITLDMLVVETDAPFMSIYPNKESIPSDTFYIVEEIARLKGIDSISCGKIIYENSNNWLKK